MCPTYGIKLETTGGSLGSYMGQNRRTSETYPMTTSSRTAIIAEDRLMTMLRVKFLLKRKSEKKNKEWSVKTPVCNRMLA